MSRSTSLFADARKHIPGGVNSPVRAFRAVGGDPVFFERGEGAVAVVDTHDGQSFGVAIRIGDGIGTGGGEDRRDAISDGIQDVLGDIAQAEVGTGVEIGRIVDGEDVEGGRLGGVTEGGAAVGCAVG